MTKKEIFTGKIIAILGILAYCYFQPDNSLCRFLGMLSLPVLFFFVGMELEPRETEQMLPKLFRKYILTYLLGAFALSIFRITRDCYIAGDSVKNALLQAVWNMIYGSKDNLAAPVQVTGMGVLSVLLMLFFAVLIVNYFIPKNGGVLWILALSVLGYCTGKVYWIPLSIQAGMVLSVFVLAGYYYKKNQCMEMAHKLWVLILGIALEVVYFQKAVMQADYYNNILPQDIYDLVAAVMAGVCVAIIITYIYKIPIFLQKAVPDNSMAEMDEPEQSAETVAEKKPRDKTMDFAKGVAILCMVYAHIMTSWNSLDILYIYSFHMPLFVLISGYFFKNESIHVMLKKKIKGIYIVYLGFGIAAILAGIWQNMYYKGQGIEENISYFITRTGHLLIGYQTWIVWFLLSLFCTIIIFAITVKIAGKHTWLRWSLVMIESVGGWYLAMHTSFVPFYFDIALASMIFFALGYEMKLHPQWREKDTANKKIALFMIAFIWLLGVHNGRLDMVLEYYPQYPLCIIAAVAGCITVIYLSEHLSKIPILSDFVIFCGRNTLCILFVHNIVRQYCDWNRICGNVSDQYQAVIQIIYLVGACFVWQGFKLFFQSRRKEAAK